MKKLVALSVLLISLGAAAQTPHKPSINGGVHNDHFNFDHASNYNSADRKRFSIRARIEV